MKEKLTNSQDRLKNSSLPSINRLNRNQSDINDELIGISESITSFYQTSFYNYEPSRLRLIYNYKNSFTKNDNTSLNIHQLTRSTSNITKFDVEKHNKVKKQIDVKKEFDDLSTTEYKKIKSKITAQPSLRHYTRHHVFAHEIKIEEQNEKNTFIKPAPKEKENKDDFDKVFKLLLRVKPRRLTLKEIRSLNVSEKFVHEVSKLIFYPKFLAFSPIWFK